jgi:DNA-binding transcriptional ArsR family regulator
MTHEEKLALAFNALAHPRRVRIFRLLAENPETGRTFAGLQETTGYKEASLLHHLQVMENAGLIRKQRTGATVNRVVTPGPLAAALSETSRLAASARGPAIKIV